MASDLQLPSEYRAWITSVSQRYRASQIRATVKVNEEMLRFYFVLGSEMEKIKPTFKFGEGFYQTVSGDLQRLLPEIKSFSPRNLNYMHRFYRLFSSFLNLPQVGAKMDFETESEKISVKNGDISKNMPEIIFQIPWGHHKYIIDRCSSDFEKALFYVRKSLENTWSRAVLLNFLDTSLYERQGKAVSNFSATLPEPSSDLAQELTRDPYNFDFLTLHERYNEKELKDALMENITKFLLELGSGFSFVGREYRLDVGDSELFLDLLFYHIRLRCYVVVEVKTTAFDPAFTGQLGTYVVAVNHLLKGAGDAPTIGLLICKNKDNVMAKYALESTGQPLGISAYDLSHLIPDDYKSAIPSIEEIEQELEK